MTTKPHGKARRTRAARARARAAAVVEAPATRPCGKHATTAVKEPEASAPREAPVLAAPPEPRRPRRRRRVRARFTATRAAVARRVTGADGLDLLLLRLGLAFVFVYAALASLADPTKFERYLPAMISHPWVTHWCLPAFAAYEIGLAAALVTVRRPVMTSTLAAVTVTGITVANPDQFDVLFRNVAIICAALALAARSRTPSPERATVIVLPD